MRLKSFWVLIFCAALAAPAAAQFYKYTDSDGNVRFTDDLNQIPEHLRSGATPYEQVESRPEASPTLEKSEDTSAPGSKTNEAGALDLAKQALDEKKRQLDAEYKSLTEKRAALDKSKKTRMTRTQALEYNKAVAKLNDEMSAYAERRKALNDEVETYNEQLKNAMKERLEKPEAAPAVKP